MDDSPAGQGASPGPRDMRAARPAAEAAPPGAVPALPHARRLDRLTGLVLFAAAAVALLPTAPLLLRALAGEPPPMQGAGRFTHLLERRSPAVERSRSHPRFPFDADPGADDPRSPREEDPALDEEAEEPGGALPLQLGIASRGITLLEEPGDGARVGAVAAGELVMIVRESGAWALVAKNQGGNMVMGWARRSEIAVR
ncbi:SH3 domain-containing protein [Sorangium sp. So ce1099]|uniref:SH3 domain-containing protein n=1 Tax=Sorangium sp. So ce1099 TaxID=3133331 RepID=UPI003F641D77